MTNLFTIDDNVIIMILYLLIITLASIFVIDFFWSFGDICRKHIFKEVFKSYHNQDYDIAKMCCVIKSLMSRKMWSNFKKYVKKEIKSISKREKEYQKLSYLMDKYQRDLGHTAIYSSKSHLEEYIKETKILMLSQNKLTDKNLEFILTGNKVINKPIINIKTNDTEEIVLN